LNEFALIPFSFIRLCDKSKFDAFTKLNVVIESTALVIKTAFFNYKEKEHPRTQG
jgi:hypothetical protein